jgi:CorA-like Mg2+ transporter protein
LLKEGPGAALWAIIDTIVDEYGPVVEGLDRDVEEVESTVFSGAAAPTERIYLLRREATDFYRAVHPLLSPLDGLERGAYFKRSKELKQFFRDVNDHVKLVDEEVVALRDVRLSRSRVAPRVPKAELTNGLWEGTIEQLGAEPEPVEVFVLCVVFEMPYRGWTRRSTSPGKGSLNARSSPSAPLPGHTPAKW